MYFNKLLYIIIRTMGWFCAALSKDSGSWSEEEEEKRESLFFREVNHLLKPIAYHRSSYYWLQQAKNIKKRRISKRAHQPGTAVCEIPPKCTAQSATLTRARRPVAISSAHPHG